MSNYYLILIWIAFIGFLGLFINMKQTENVRGEQVQRMNTVWAIILILPLVIWTGYRGGVGDTGAYMQAFWNMPGNFDGISEYIGTVNKDKGFYLASALIKTLITKNVDIYLLIVGAMQAFLLFRLYRRFSSRYMISFFLFIASTDYVSWMFNGMRQFVAVTITLAAFEFVLDKKYVKAILIILFASLFHQSALLVIPCVFLAQGKAWNKRTLLFIAAVVFAAAFVDQFVVLLDSMLEETQYTNVVSDWEDFQDNGTNVIRVLVYSIPTIISLLGLKFIREENDPVINICTNMSILSAGIYVVSIFTSGIFIGRLPIYFSLYNYILLPWEIEHIFNKKSAMVIYIVMIVAYLAFYYFQMHLAWGIV